MGTFLKMRVSEIRVNQIRVNQGLGVYTIQAAGYNLMGHVQYINSMA